MRAKAWSVNLLCKMSTEFTKNVYSVVRRIPRGRVVSYGQIASLCGKPQASRIVGQIAHWGPVDLPWHRVVYKDGNLSRAYSGGGYLLQKRLLEEEGIFVGKDQKIRDLPQLLWAPTLESVKSNSIPLISIVGETASGKSALAHELARKFNGEIISADSWAVYKGFDIGTAKPSEGAQKEVDYHLIDVVDPQDGFNAVIFKKLANKAMGEIRGRGKIPILAGGTGLYVDSVVFDYSFTPVGASDLRASLNALSIPQLLDKIKLQNYNLDGVDVRNKRRLIRLIESRGQRPSQRPLREDTLIIGITISRSELRRNIEKRVEKMFRLGLKREVSDLYNLYGWDIEPMKGIGYREFREYYEGSQSLANTKRNIVKSTINLAKRQRTWNKRNRNIIWVKSQEEAIVIAERFLR
jgi:tRNA dimethylallyltransferase